MTNDSLARLSDALERRRDELQALPGVVGTGVGAATNGELAVQVFVRSETDAPGVERRAAELLEQVPLEVIVAGDVTAASVEEGEDDGKS
ncbi:MAG TPA: hypothetical protein VK490_02355 [Gaiellaceae bacterium]|jgi:hypothetical protein|nr:hypothetical protein [Gaiellaceae bacterium]